MCVLVQESLRISVFGADHYEGRLDHPFDALPGIKIAVMVQMFHPDHM